MNFSCCFYFSHFVRWPVLGSLAKLVSFLSASSSCFPLMKMNNRLPSETFSSKVFESMNFRGHSCHRFHQWHFLQSSPLQLHDAKVCTSLDEVHHHQVHRECQIPLQPITSTPASFPLSSEVRMKDCRKLLLVDCLPGLAFFSCCHFSYLHWSCGQEGQKWRAFMEYYY
jgi:hypothetical protein